MLHYLPATSLINFITLLATFILIWIIKELFYIVSVRRRGLKSFYQLPGYSFFLDWEVLQWPAQKISSLHLKKRKELGPIFALKIRMFQPNVIIISDPAIIESIYKIDGKFPSRTGSSGGFRILSSFTKEPGGLLVSEGEDWSRKRKPVSRSILNASIINQYIPELNDISRSLTERILDSLDESRYTSSFQFLIRCASVEGVGSFVYQKNLGYLSKDLTEESKSLLESGFSFFHAVNLLNGYSFISRLLNAKKLYGNLQSFRTQYLNQINESISIRLAGGGDFQSDRFDFMSNILKDKSLTRAELRVLSNSLFIAGIDTTATTVLMTLYHLGHNLDKQRKLREEIHSVVGDREDITRQDLDDLKYLKFCVREGQRLHPAVFLTSRVSKKDLVLNGYHIPKNSQFIINNYVLGRQAELFSNPEAYIPERWEQPALQHPYYFLPFGYGPRMCVGKMFAELVIYIFLTQIIRRLEVFTINNFEICGNLFLESDRDLIFKVIPVE